MLTIAVSSRSLFHMEEANDIYEREGQGAFDAYMRSTEAEPLPPGAAFPLVSKLLALNSARSPHKRDRVEVVLLSRNSADAGMRVMNSVQHYGLDIESAAFTSGGNRFAYASAMDADLFLCAEAEDARKAITGGMAAAIIVPAERKHDAGDMTVRIAFDGDSVLFSDEADSIYREHGMERFRTSEIRDAAKPLGDGPFKRLLVKLCELQKALPANACPLHIALVTARGMPAHGRVINTLRSWGLSVNELVLAAGRPKGPLLQALRADMFFDDTGRNVESATAHNISAGQVPFGAGGIAEQQAA